MSPCVTLQENASNDCGAVLAESSSLLLAPGGTFKEFSLQVTNTQRPPQTHSNAETGQHRAGQYIQTAPQAHRQVSHQLVFPKPSFKLVFVNVGKCKHTHCSTEWPQHREDPTQTHPVLPYLRPGPGLFMRYLWSFCLHIFPWTLVDAEVKLTGI